MPAGEASSGMPLKATLIALNAVKVGLEGRRMPFRWRWARSGSSDGAVWQDGVHTPDIIGDLGDA